MEVYLKDIAKSELPGSKNVDCNVPQVALNIFNIN